MSTHRYYELKHFSLQYQEWKSELSRIDILRSGKIEERHGDLEFSDPTGELAIKRESLIHRIDLINESAKISGGDIFEYLLKSVAYGYSFKTLQADGIPCGKDYFYERYRKYFYILDKLRD